MVDDAGVVLEGTPFELALSGAGLELASGVEG